MELRISESREWKYKVLFNFRILIYSIKEVTYNYHESPVWKTVHINTCTICIPYIHVHAGVSIHTSIYAHIQKTQAYAQTNVCVLITYDISTRKCLSTIHNSIGPYTNLYQISTLIYSAICQAWTSATPIPSGQFQIGPGTRWQCREGYFFQQ